MEWMLVGLLLAVGVQGFNRLEQGGRVALLAQHLRRHQVESLMGQLTEGYLRALETSDPDRQRQLWAALDNMAQELCRQFSAFTADFSQVYGGQTQVSRLPFALPRAAQLFPSAAFDAREAFAIHARGLSAVVANEAQLSNRDKAYMLTAELYLMQHTCHWFCRSKNVASARLLAQHKTSYAQVLQAVSAPTRQAYQRLVGAAT